MAIRIFIHLFPTSYLPLQEKSIRKLHPASTGASPAPHLEKKKKKAKQNKKNIDPSQKLLLQFPKKGGACVPTGCTDKGDPTWMGEEQEGDEKGGGGCKAGEGGSSIVPFVCRGVSACARDGCGNRDAGHHTSPASHITIPLFSLRDSFKTDGGMEKEINLLHIPHHKILPPARKGSSQRPSCNATCFSPHHPPPLWLFRLFSRWRIPFADCSFFSLWMKIRKIPVLGFRSFSGVIKVRGWSVLKVVLFLLLASRVVGGGGLTWIGCDWSLR